MPHTHRLKHTYTHTATHTHTSLFVSFVSDAQQLVKAEGNKV